MNSKGPIYMQSPEELLSDDYRLAGIEVLPSHTTIVGYRILQKRSDPIKKLTIMMMMLLIVRSSRQWPDFVVDDNFIIYLFVMYKPHTNVHVRILK